VVIPTIDNLVKPNWHGSTKYVFSHNDETVKHVIFPYKFARSIWLVIQVVSTLYPPCSVVNIFTKWLHDVNHKFRILI
jgi:hypothetical protein